MRGLDPRIHDGLKLDKPYGFAVGHRIMDCGVKPSNDHK
jgi:hypothetical protein